MAIGVANGVFFANYKKQPWFIQSSEYFERVTLDLGAIRSQQAVKDIYKFLDSEGLYTDTKLLWFGDAGIKTRATTVASTPLTFVSKGYSLDPTPNDLTQTTELNQPYLSGNIAPNERYALKNLTGGGKNIINPSITFTAVDNWSVTLVVKNIGGTGSQILFSNGNNINSAWYINNGALYDSDGVLSNLQITDINNKLLTKTTVITLVRNNVDGKIDLYVNGVYSVTSNLPIGGFIFRNLFSHSTSREFKGNIFYHRIQSGAMTATQVAAEYSMLRSIYPEIESVTIGTQTWATSNLEMVATPMGNVIPEVQLASATEMLTADGTFSTSSGWTELNGANIIDGELVVNEPESGTIFTTGDLQPIIQNRYYKVTIEITEYTSGDPLRINVGSSGNPLYISNSLGLQTFYYKASRDGDFKLQLRTMDSGWVGKIDNISVQELGWADRQELYDGLIAQGMSVADATKECAAWCYHSNDPNLGAVMGKLYNPFAVKLMANDIAAYNVANPTAHWGWNAPTRAQLTTLSSQGGNASKVGGTNYWTTANGTNTNGLTLLGSGYRQADGTFAELRATTGLLCRDADFARKVLNADNTFDEAAVTLDGYPIRLIKDE